VANVIYTQLYLLVGILAFWIKEGSFLIQFVKKFVKFLASGYIPITLFPLLLQKILVYLPFAATIYFPTIVLTDKKLTNMDLLRTIMLQAFWFVMLLIVNQWLWNKGIHSPADFLNSNSWDGRVAFAEGTVGMYVAGAWFAGTLMQEFPDVTGQWATAPLPQDERCATTIAGDSLVLFQASDHPEAAWKWMEFVSAPENMRLLNLGTPDAPSTLLPPRKSPLEDPATFENNPLLQGFAENMKCGVTNTISQPKWPEIESLLNEALGRAIYGEIDAAAAIDQAAQEAQAVLEQ
jgi:ABC-type glycerol-3-phosphate transport system substrate-binding protein